MLSSARRPSRLRMKRSARCVGDAAGAGIVRGSSGPASVSCSHKWEGFGTLQTQRTLQTAHTKCVHEAWHRLPQSLTGKCIGCTGQEVLNLRSV